MGGAEGQGIRRWGPGRRPTEGSIKNERILGKVVDSAHAVVHPRSCRLGSGIMLARTCFLALLLCNLAQAADRFVESVLPSLDYGPSCWSAVNLQNLGNRDVTVEVEAHRESGALVPLVGQGHVAVRLSSGEK